MHERRSRGKRDARDTLKINYRPCHASLARARVFTRSLPELAQPICSRLFCQASLLLLKLQNCDKPSLRKSLLYINSTLFIFWIPNYFAAMNRKSYPIRIIIRVHQFWLRIISSMARIRNHKRRRKWFPFLEVLLVRAWAKLVLYRGIIGGRSSAKIKRFVLIWLV